MVPDQLLLNAILNLSPSPTIISQLVKHKHGHTLQIIQTSEKNSAGAGGGGEKCQTACGGLSPASN